MYGSPLIVTGNVIFSAHCLVFRSVAGKILFRITDFGQSYIGTSEYRIEGKSLTLCRISDLTVYRYLLWESLDIHVRVCVCEHGQWHGCGHGNERGHGKCSWMWMWRWTWTWILTRTQKCTYLKKMLISDIRLFLYWISLILELTKKSRSFLVDSGIRSLNLDYIFTKIRQKHRMTDVRYRFKLAQPPRCYF
jgi:hypothetical protein